MTAYERFKNLHIAHAAIGLEQSDTDVTYYCTPKDSNIIGWAGVDGIHYCTIGGFGDMIFAVSPMNFGDCVHPIARNFEDLLRMLLFCGDMAALEQFYGWDEEQFKAFLIDCPVTGKQTEVLNVIREEFGLEPMEDTFSYVKKLQAEFDLRKIPYTEDYYDPDINAAAPAPVQWNVNFEGNCPEDCCPCTERPIGKVFSWGDERWHIPAVYSCAKGLVIDFCVEIDPGKTAAWIRKWDLTNEESHKYTPEEQRQIEEENPLKIGFRPILLADNEKLRPERSSSKCWIPPCCLDGADQNQAQTRLFLEHYGLDESRCWAFYRTSFPWDTNEPPVPASLTLHLEREMTEIPVTRFDTPAVGETIVFSHPVTGVTHTLTVEAFEPQTMDLSRINPASPVIGTGADNRKSANQCLHRL